MQKFKCILSIVLMIALLAAFAACGQTRDKQTGGSDDSLDVVLDNMISKTESAEITPQEVDITNFYHLGEHYIGRGYRTDPSAVGMRSCILICFNSQMELTSYFTYPAGDDITLISDNYFVLADDNKEVYLFDSALNNLTSTYPNAKTCYYETKLGRHSVSFFDDDGLKYFDITDNSTYSETTYTLSVYDMLTDEKITDIILDRELSSADKFQTRYIGGGYLYSAPYLINYRTGLIVNIGSWDRWYVDFYYYDQKIYAIDSHPGGTTSIVTCFDERGTQLWQRWHRGDNFDIATGEANISFARIEEREGHKAKIEAADIHGSFTGCYGLSNSDLAYQHYLSGYAVLQIENENGEFVALSDRDGNFLIGPFAQQAYETHISIKVGEFCAKYGLMIEKTNSGCRLVGRNGKTVDVPTACTYGDPNSSESLVGFGLKHIIGVENGFVYFNNVGYGKDDAPDTFVVALDISSIL
ncbi:MAG: hypothetical protein IJ766_08875 [Clostridia bacterium]|nr:hypothetical protein [Clostridia bacterium]